METEPQYFFPKATSLEVGDSVDLITHNGETLIEGPIEVLEAEPFSTDSVLLTYMIKDDRKLGFVRLIPKTADVELTPPF